MDRIETLNAAILYRKTLTGPAMRRFDALVKLYAIMHRAPLADGMIHAYYMFGHQGE